MIEQENTEPRETEGLIFPKIVLKAWIDGAIRQQRLIDSRRGLVEFVDIRRAAIEVKKAWDPGYTEDELPLYE